MKAELKKAACSLLSVAAALALGVLLGGDIEKACLALKRPWYLPPPAVFLILCPVVYLLIAYAFYQALRSPLPNPYTRRGMTITFLSGLLLGALWPMAFFRFSFFTLAFYLLAAMLILGAFTLADFYRASRRAALCYLPYLIGLVFMLFLNHAAARLNG